jgi:hypothetical protein
VADLAFYLAGKPKQIATYTSGGNQWHPSASVFSGAGVSEHGALFSYSANWESAGRWSVEVLTAKHRLIFRPMEKLQITKKGSVAIEFVEIEDTLDIQFKPGLYKQTELFLNDEVQDFCTIQEQSQMAAIYSQIANYKTI